MQHKTSPARRRLGLAALALGAAAAVAPGLLLAQDWPTRPVKLIVPFPAGGSTDAVGRLLAAELSKELGQSVVVENKGGANGNIGSDVVAKAEPDGYTLLLSGVGSNAISYSLYQSMPYRDSDFAHISLLATGPNVLVANMDFPATNFADFIKLVRANPGKYTHASSGNGSSGHLAMEMLKQAAKLDLVHVPYKGGAAAITDMIGGRVSVMFLNQDSLLPQVRSGKLRALAVASAARAPAIPDVPTFAEAGVPDFLITPWFGVMAPAGTPAPVLDTLHDAFAQALQAPEVAAKMRELGVETAAGSRADLGRFVTTETAKWKQVIETNHIKAE